MAQSVPGRGCEPREHGRQLVEGALAGDQRVERGVREQPQRRAPCAARESSARAAPSRRRRPATTSASSGGCGTRRRAARPARHRRTSSARRRRFEARQLERGREAGARCRSCGRRDRRRARAVLGARNGTPSACAAAALRASMSTSSTSAPTMRAASHATRQPTVPAPITATRSPTRGAASHSALTAVSRLAASTARAGGTIVGQHVQRADGHDVARLVRIQAEDVPAAQLRGPLLDDADVAVAVLDGRGKLAGLKRRAHALVLAARHLAVEHERFGAAADAAVERADERFALGRRGQASPRESRRGRLRPPRTRALDSESLLISSGGRKLAALARAYLQTGRQACKRHASCRRHPLVEVDRRRARARAPLAARRRGRRCCWPRPLRLSADC